METEAASSASVNFWEICECVRTSQRADPGLLHKWEALVGSVFIFYILLSETSSACTGIRLMPAKQTPLIYWQWPKNSVLQWVSTISYTFMCLQISLLSKVLIPASFILHLCLVTTAIRTNTKWEVEGNDRFFTNKNLKCAACTPINPNSDIIQMSRQIGQGQH